EDDRAGAPRLCDAKGASDVLGDAFRALDLRHPLDDAAVHAPVVDFLECFAVGKVAADLADEDDQRRRILCRGMDADRGIRRARAARDEDDARASGKLAVRFSHIRRAAFLTADDQAQAIAYIVEGVEHRQIALARYAE